LTQNLWAERKLDTSDSDMRGRATSFLPRFLTAALGWAATELQGHWDTQQGSLITALAKKKRSLKDRGVVVTMSMLLWSGRW